MDSCLNPQIANFKQSLPYNTDTSHFLDSSLGTKDTEPHTISKIQTPLSYGLLSETHR